MKVKIIVFFCLSFKPIYNFYFKEILKELNLDGEDALKEIKEQLSEIKNSTKSKKNQTAEQHIIASSFNGLKKNSKNEPIVKPCNLNKRNCSHYYN